jgi:hypothetical protein
MLLHHACVCHHFGKSQNRETHWAADRREERIGEGRVSEETKKKKKNAETQAVDAREGETREASRVQRESQAL